MEEIKNRTRVFLSNFIKKKELQDTDDIFAIGDVNSLFAMQLVMFIEKEFGIEIENSDLNLNNFRSIQAITTFVTSKSAAVGQ
ncbi:phosphopantetheine-binding protein [Paenibacillus alvei]|uniref:Phosphopantetheine-binding protein n=1 Tax=Paenibacillus alvei TaxID=44250 RepID=A0ABT4GZ00_PAEAL|nr:MULTISPECIES: phosphopantetheine-binding protein [Paenibacillus]MCY7484600.1 phosphopantetheine-binding protein [Paenibacillus alvei]MCY9761941.1 phosphopantetheine-binding protein [Paenibacillus alvei]MCY9768517.1 phosphopantetheine-binding protein [Paenibacillus alvei]NEZ42244.1 acyl carrier protein [Paenibacillus alvei]